MRLNKFIASGSPLSRRAADDAVARNRVTVNGQLAQPGMDVGESDVVMLDGQRITPDSDTVTIMLNKPTGYVVSRDGQGAQTVYDLLPPQYQHLQPVGRLDKDSSGLLLLTNDGQLANELTHPSHQMQKVYQVTLDKPLTSADIVAIEQGVRLDDGYLSHLHVSASKNPGSSISIPAYEIRLSEGKNRQIRRTFAALGYQVINLHRYAFGSFRLAELGAGEIKELDADN